MPIEQVPYEALNILQPLGEGVFGCVFLVELNPPGLLLSYKTVNSTVQAKPAATSQMVSGYTVFSMPDIPRSSDDFSSVAFDMGDMERQQPYVTGSNCVSFEMRGMEGQACAGPSYVQFGHSLRVHPQTVTLEKLSPELAQSQQSLLQEAKIMSQLNHPNIVRLFGIINQGGGVDRRVGILMQFAGLGDLFLAIHGGAYPGNLFDPIRDKSMTGIAKAIEYLHQNDIVHGDLKPANVLLSGGGSEGVVAQLGDFGCSQEVPKGGTIWGALFDRRYGAPELLAHQDYDCAVDLYAFGLILWEMYTRAVPYADSDNHPHQCDGIISGRIRPTLDLLPYGEMSKLILSLWSSVPSDRPSAQSVCEKIEAFLSPPPFVA